MKKQFKIIFLDIDGVLAPHQKSLYKETNYFPYNITFSQECVKQLKRVLDETGAHLVISSRWAKRLSLESILVTLASHGINGPYVLPHEVEEDEKPIKDILSDSKSLHGVVTTPKKLSSDKCHEIGFWLGYYGENVESYVIVDDDEIYPNYDSFKERFERQVITDEMVGLTSEKAVEMIRLLNKPLERK